MANLLGIDIGPTSVRGVLVKTQLRRAQLAQYIEVPIVDVPPDALDSGALDGSSASFGSVTSGPGAMGPLPAPIVPAIDPAAAFPTAGTGTPSPFGGGPYGAEAAPQVAPTPAVDPTASSANPPVVTPPTDVLAPVPLPTASTPLARAMAELIRRAGGANIDVVAPLSGDAVSLRRVELPKAAEKKIDELLPFEMESLIPFEVADTLLDHQPIDGDAKLIRLLVSAAPKARIREQLATLTEIGADPVELVPSPAAIAGIAQFVPSLAEGGPHLVIVLGHASSDVCVVKKGRAELARTLSIGGGELWRGGEPTPFAPAAGAIDETAASHFVRELKQTILAYRMQGGADPETVVVGGEADVPGLFDRLSQGLGRSVVPLAMPAVGAQAGATAVAAPPASSEPTFALAPYATALAVVGHSLQRGKHLDFRKGEFVKKRDLSVLRDFGPILGIASAAVACAFFFSIWARWSVLDARRELLEDELARVSAERLGEETRNPTRARALLETGRRSPDPMPAFTAFDALVAVSGAVPEGVSHDLSRLAIDMGDGRSEGHLEVQGTVGSVDDAERISRALSEVECFRELELGPATTTADGRRNYRIEGDILCPGGGGDDEDDDEGGGRRGRGGSSSDDEDEGGEG